ncbi:hypothetical protein [Trebonia kvetii]|nr:hypothetical protein [Trebonia kvetii]
MAGQDSGHRLFVQVELVQVRDSVPAADDQPARGWVDVEVPVTVPAEA